MFRLILLLFVVVITTIPVVGQQDAKSNSAAPTTAGRKGLDEGRPSVYITFERFGVREPRGDDGDPNRIYLRLHNNSPWTVDFCISGLFDSTGRENGLKSRRTERPLAKEKLIDRVPVHLRSGTNVINPDVLVAVVWCGMRSPGADKRQRIAPLRFFGLSHPGHQSRSDRVGTITESFRRGQDAAAGFRRH